LLAQIHSSWSHYDPFQIFPITLLISLPYLSCKAYHLLCLAVDITPWSIAALICICHLQERSCWSFFCSLLMNNIQIIFYLELLWNSLYSQCCVVCLHFFIPISNYSVTIYTLGCSSNIIF
jgi:hypothetical protein